MKKVKGQPTEWEKIFASHKSDKGFLYRILKTLFKNIYIFFVERGEGKEKKRERNINVWLPLTCAPTGDLARNPGMCPDWESNWQLFGSQAGTQSIQPHQPGAESLKLLNSTIKRKITQFKNRQLQ